MSATEITAVVLEPAAEDFADATANPPYLFDLGPQKGRETVDEVQSEEIDRPEVEIEDRTVPGGPGGDVSVRIMRPKGTDAELPVISRLRLRCVSAGASGGERQCDRDCRFGDFAAVSRARGVGVDSSARAALSWRGGLQAPSAPSRAARAGSRRGLRRAGCSAGCDAAPRAVLMLSGVMIAAVWIVCCAM
jgi:hypothetical protein